MQNPNGGVDQQTYRDVVNISWIHDVIFQRAQIVAKALLTELVS
jgi:hypothetical protein